jgi:hypothetical protein
MPQLKVTIDEDLRARLDAVSAESGDSLAEEIRERLEQVLRDEIDFDERTRELGRNVMRLARLIERHAQVPWHDHGAARTAFVFAFARYIEGYTPRPDGPGKLAPAMSGPGQAEAVGRVIGTNFLHDLALEARIKKTDFPKMSAKQFRQLKRNLGDPGNLEPQLELVKTPPPELVKKPPAGTAPPAGKARRKKMEDGTHE